MTVWRKKHAVFWKHPYRRPHATLSLTRPEWKRRALMQDRDDSKKQVAHQPAWVSVFHISTLPAATQGGHGHQITQLPPVHVQFSQ